MNEHYMSADRVVVIGLWTFVLAVAMATTGGAIWGHLDEQWVRVAMVALTPLTGLAMVLHFRLYAVRLCSLIRATAGLDREDSELRSVR